MQMKNSGINWIGEIPLEWEISKLKYESEFVNGDRGENYPSGNDMVDNGIIFVTSNNIHNMILDNDTGISKYITEEKYYTLGGAKLELNDIIFCLRGSVGKCSINKTEKEGTIASSLVDIKVRNSNANFLNYFLHSEIINYQNYIYMNGSCAANLSAENVSNYYFIKPEIKEQEIISDFLDDKVGKIDSIIVDLNKQVKILMEYKKSVIIEKVTKGLNSHVLMKDIKSDLIHKIPHNWKEVRMQDIGEYKKGPFGSAITIEMFVEKSENTYKVYEQKNAINHDETLGWYYIDENDFRRLKDFEVFTGDIIVSCAGTMGKCHILPNTMEKGIINQALMKISLNNGVNKSYFLYLFDIVIEKIADKYSNGSAIKNIPPFSILKKYKIPYPPIEEQQEIVDYLNKKCFQIDQLIKDKQTQIEKMEKYKKSLIYEYVTGKKRVKGAEELYG